MHLNERPGGQWGLVFAALVGGLVAASPATAQFSTGSTGADGALVFACSPGEVIEWDPAGLDVENDNVFEFTTVSIPADCTIRLTTARLGPESIRWLATGAVQIDGTIDLDGAVGHDSSLGSTRVLAQPGPGGFPGGLGLVNGLGVRSDGFGPGGSEGRRRPNGAGHGSAGGFGTVGVPVGTTYGNEFLLPLMGGSGGGGDAGGGGAGGGAVLIASSVSINIDGEILARGGSGGGTVSAGGSGGAIRLVAPLISGAGALRTNGGDGPGFGGAGGRGRVRLEATTYQWTGSITAGVSRTTALAPNAVLIAEEPLPRLRLVSIAGQPVPVQPGGLFNPVDVVMNEAGPISIEVAGENVPLGTVVDVEIHNESLGSQTVQTSPLAGPDESATTATATATMEAGFSSVAIRARFDP